MPNWLVLLKPASSMTMVTELPPVVCHSASLPSARQLLATLGAPAPRSEPNTCCNVCSLPGGPTVQVALALENTRHSATTAGAASHALEKRRIGPLLTAACSSLQAGACGLLVTVA